MCLKPPAPPPRLPPAPWGKPNQPPPHVCFPPSLDYTSSLPANCRPLSETFLLILISFTITIFHVCGVLCLAGKGKDNYPGVPGINPARCHLMACLPQWLMNRLLLSNHLHPLLFGGACQFAQLGQVGPVRLGLSPPSELSRRTSRSSFEVSCLAAKRSELTVKCSATGRDGKCKFPIARDWP